MTIALNDIADVRSMPVTRPMRAAAPSRRNSVAANDFRRPEPGTAEYGLLDGHHSARCGVVCEERLESPSLAVTVAGCLLAALVVFGLFGVWNWRVGGPAGADVAQPVAASVAGAQAGDAGGASGASGPATTAVVEVRAGESLPDLAARIAPGVPVGDVVATILDMNGLSGEAVHAGQVLLAPASR